MFQEALLAVHAAERGSRTAAADFFLLFLAGQQQVIGEEVADIGVTGIALAQAVLVREHAANLGLDIAHGIAQEDAVVVALGHLAAVETGTLGGGRQHGLRFREGFAVQVVEAPGDFPRQLHVRKLILAHGHAVRLVHQNIRGHQHGVAQETRVAEVLVADLLLLFLVGGVPLQPGNRRDHGQQQRKLGMFLDGGLPENHALFGIKTGGDPVLHHFVDIIPHPGGVRVVAGQGVPVSDEEVGFFRALQLHIIFQHAEIVAQMQRARGAHAGNGAGTLIAHGNPS